MQLDSEQIKSMIGLLAGFEVCMLTTETKGGLLRSRPMAAPSIDERGRLLFFSQVHTPKMDEIRHEQQVNISFLSEAEERYISVSGIARAYADGDLARRFWSAPAEEWLPHGFDQATIRVLAVEVEEVDCWDRSERRMQEFFALSSPPARFSSEEDEWQQMMEARDTSIDVLVADPADEPPD